MSLFMFCSGNTAIVFFAAAAPAICRCLNHQAPIATKTVSSSALTPNSRYVDNLLEV